MRRYHPDGLDVPRTDPRSLTDESNHIVSLTSIIPNGTIERSPPFQLAPPRLAGVGRAAPLIALRGATAARLLQLLQICYCADRRIARAPAADVCDNAFPLRNSKFALEGSS
jgi:hypothetical protein